MFAWILLALAIVLALLTSLKILFLVVVAFLIVGFFAPSLPSFSSSPFWKWQDYQKSRQEKRRYKEDRKKIGYLEEQFKDLDV